MRPDGQIILIVGDNGSGKSNAAKSLICRFQQILLHSNKPRYKIQNTTTQIIGIASSKSIFTGNVVA